MKFVLIDIFGIFGVGFVGAGCWMIRPEFGLIIVGLILLGFCMAGISRL
tara:strand:+ start:2013 stop:2159 length:147 start_codon:yes stop_codon:yes gene_type:complete